MDINNPIPNGWRDYVTQTNLGLEIVPAMLYSIKDYVSSATRELFFFDTVQGARPDLTNMQNANQLANPESFLIQAIRFFVHSPVQSDDSGDGAAMELVSTFNDVVKLTRTAILKLKIGNKNYGPWPLWTISAGNFAKGSLSTGSDLAADYAQIDGPMYALFPNLMLSPLQPFNVSIAWPGGPVALSTGAESTLPLEIVFDGQLARAIS